MQKGVLTGFDQGDAVITHGAILFLQVTAPAAARKSLAKIRPGSEAAPAADGLHRNVAITYPGLVALGLPAEVLADCPREFVQGAEARAPQLGDVRGFHPRHWRRPSRNWGAGAGGEIDLSSIDVVIQLRTRDDRTDGADIPSDDRHPLRRKVEALSRLSGLRLLGVETLRRRGDGSDQLGFADGISQPDLIAGSRHRVPARDLLLGLPDERGTDASLHPFFTNGSFLALRAMRVDRGAFEGMVAAAADSTKLAKEVIVRRLLGREPDGTSPLGGGGNDFDYSGDAEGAVCPFGSHIRRSNPRATDDSGRIVSPRIMRRGMPFERPNGERGILFMAYCGSLAQQYEVVQRWVNGGNSTRVGSMPTDPIAGVPRAGGEGFCFLHRRGVGGGTAATTKTERVRVADAAAPVTALDWTLYAFTPSLSALESLRRIEAAVAATPPSGAGADPADTAWRALLSDFGPQQSARSEAFWRQARADGGTAETPLGTVLSTSAAIRPVLEDRGATYSVRGYGERFAGSLGSIYLGLDADTPDYEAQAAVGNGAIGAVDADRAFGLAHGATAARLRAMLGTSPHAVDLAAGLIDPVMAALCQAYFAVPDGKRIVAGGADWRQDRPTHCPGDLYAPTRFVFGPLPSATLTAAGRADGERLTRDVLALRREGHDFAPGIISQALVAASPFAGDADLFARTVAGMMTGFVPVTFANLANVLARWIEDGTLFRAQEDWLRQADAAGRRLALVRRMAVAMKRSPAPELIWRTRRQATADGTVILCLDSAAQGELDAAPATAPSQPDGSDDRSLDVIFGGTGYGVHACPGRAMGIGTMLGILAALFETATMRRNGVPLSLDMLLRA